ncbi:MAG: type II toxin-antitoxin system RelB/DinJ family antitoxin [Clostridiales bacterium]|nr:type II toxin-antitoxin system RelB/DinJ family antitoxin [Clostridiales bacterium]
MAKNDTSITVRVDKDLKENAEQVLSYIGLNMTSAINVFLRKVVDEKAIPFMLNSRKLGITTTFSEDEITKRMNDALREDFKFSREHSLPVALYDENLKKAYVEYPDGRREYV